MPRKKSKPDPSTAGSNWEAMRKELRAEQSHAGVREKGVQKAPKPKLNRFKAAYQNALEGLKRNEATSALNTVTETLALDCEYVGTGFSGNIDHLARVSIVNSEGKCVYDKYVKPVEEVTDYRTHVSGIRPGNLVNGLPFAVVQQEVGKLLSNRVVVGHGLSSDFKVLGLNHPQRLIRDSATWKPIRKIAQCAGKPSLKMLAFKVLGVTIQEGEHDSLIDARTALRIYQLHKKRWDSDVKGKAKR